MQKLPDRRDDAAAHFEDPPRIRIDNQIEVALAIPRLDVLEPVPLLGQRQQALRQELQRRDMDAELVRFRAKEVSLDADPIADVQQLEDAEVGLRHGVLPDVDLNPRSPIGQLKKAGFPERANGEDAAGDSRRDPWRFEFLRRLRAMFGDEAS